MTFSVSLNSPDSNFLKLTEYRYLKAFYESKVNWKETTDHMRCNPNFHLQGRYDNVIVETNTGPIFAQLRFMFTVAVGDTVIPLALVQAFDYKHSRGSRGQKDKDLQFIRLQQRPAGKVEFIFARSIIRGAVLVPAYDDEKDSIVFDVLDTDMYLRAKEIRSR